MVTALQELNLVLFLCDVLPALGALHFILLKMDSYGLLHLMEQV